MNKPRTANLSLAYFLADVVAIVAAYYTTLLIRFNSAWGAHLFTWINRAFDLRETGFVGEGFEQFYLNSAPRILTILIVTVCTLYALRNLYAEHRQLRRPSVAWNVLLANVLALAIFYTYFYLQRNVFHPRSMFATMLFCNVWYTVALRGITDRVLRHLRVTRGIDRYPVLIVGNDRRVAEIRDRIAASPTRSLVVASETSLDHTAPFNDELQRIRGEIDACGARMVILADSEFSIGRTMRFLEFTDELDIAVKVLSHEMDVLVTRAHIEDDLVSSVPLIHFEAPSVARRFQGFKRIVSFSAALALVVMLSPLMLIAALLVRLTSPGPVLYVQERIGINHRPFRMWKFRTMYRDADAKVAQMETMNESGAGLFKIRQDPRVTPVGRFMRRYSIDELPQLFNVLRGDMTLVGPRPLPRRDFENYYADWHYGRHGGLPGLTCLWQVSGRSDLDFHNMCVLDVYYLRNQNWVLDVKILLRTVWVVLFAKGAY